MALIFLNPESNIGVHRGEWEVVCIGGGFLQAVSSAARASVWNCELHIERYQGMGVALVEIARCRKGHSQPEVRVLCKANVGAGLQVQLGGQ